MEVRGINKHFGSVVALEGLDLKINPGEVLGLVGQNGSGKSTLLRVLAGLSAPDQGSVHVRGQEVRLRSAKMALSLGIGMVHQEQSLVPNLSVAENIFLDKPHSAKRRGLYRWSALNDAARVQLAKIQVSLDPAAPVESLRFAERQQVELAKVLSIEELVPHPPVILFDEPTAVLTPDEIALLFSQIDRLRKRAAIVFVSHRLDEVLTLCDRVVVMTDGRKMADRQTKEVSRNDLYHLMVGRHQTLRPPTTSIRAAAPRPVRLRVRDACSGHRFHNVNFDLHEGEIIGLAGVMGSGAEEVCRALFGAEEMIEGALTLNDRQLIPRTPAQAVREGIGYLPSNRKQEGILKGRSLTQNMVLTFGLEYGWHNTVVRSGVEDMQARTWMQRLKVKAASARVPIETLSGGNQQKVVLGKWLLASSLQLLMLDHPTRGLDPGARDDLFEAIRAEARKGLSVLFVGDTIAEILELADKVIVMKDGEITARYDLLGGEVPSEEEIVRAMV